MDLLASGPDRPPRRLPRVRLDRTARALLLLVAAVLAAGVLTVPSVRAAGAPPRVTAVPSGGAVVAGRLRVYLLLLGPPSARLAAVRPLLPGNDVRADLVPDAFSRAGDAVVRLDVAPRCPGAVEGLDAARLDVTVGGRGGPHTVRVPFDTSGLLAGTVRARCALASGQLVETPPVRGPRVRAGGSGPGGVLRTVVDLGAPGPEVLVVSGVTAGPGLAADVVTGLPLRIGPGHRGRLVVDLRRDGCSADPESPPFVLEYAAEGEVEPFVDEALRGRLDALRSGGCGR